MYSMCCFFCRGKFIPMNYFYTPYFYNFPENANNYYGLNSYPCRRRKSFTTCEAKNIGRALGVKFDKFDVEQFRIGLCVELEHGTQNPLTNITNDDCIMTGKITLAHLNEYPDYYKRLTKMEKEAGKYWNDREK
ncbi:DUF5661 family protein [Clostridium lundense]|uniref:DUF5661 family protein n=1 Tax=Clostridium lundense TaxID=319475 RepID=UPI000A871A28|nr:DUF5661 family protein [Clostridium lundense]